MLTTLTALTTRTFWVWLLSALGLLSAFGYFTSVGWHGEIHQCAAGYPDHRCFCEDFSYAAAQGTTPGVRQFTNTWSNLYALLTSFIVAFVVYRDRTSAQPASVLIRSNFAVADLYVFVVLFVGLGSMWLHGSIKQWGGYVDGASMYAFTAFMVSYTVHRLYPSLLLFWVGYVVLVVTFTAINYLTPWDDVLVLVAAYLLLEIVIGIRSGYWLGGSAASRRLWFSAVAIMVAAVVFWLLSQTGGPLCRPQSILQPHGLLWHIPAGVVATLLYFYWRVAR